MSAALAEQDVDRFLLQRYNRQRPHQFNKGLAPAVAEEKLKGVSGVSQGQGTGPAWSCMLILNIV